MNRRGSHLTRCFLLFSHLSKRLNYVDHVRRLANGDWAGAGGDEEQDMDKQEEDEEEKEKQQPDGKAEEEEMEIERRKLPKHYANQVSVA